MSRLVRLSLLTTAAVAAGAAPAAADWPMYGGDQGRSGLQVRSDAAPPVRPLFAVTATGEPRTPPVITARTGDGAARVAFGTADGRVHVVKADSTGTRVGAPTGVAIDDGPVDDPDTFTGLAGGQGIAFVSVPGNLFVLHNDDDQDGTNDIAIAQIADATATKPGGADFAVAGTDGFTVSASPVISGPDATGERALFFIAYKPSDGAPGPLEEPEETRLFRVAINGATGSAPAYGPVSSVVIAGTNGVTPPTLVSLADAGGNPTAHVVVPTNSANTIQTFRALDLAAGPKSGDLGDSARTVATAIGRGGLPAALSESLFVAVGQGGDSRANVFRLVHTAGSTSLQVADQSHVVEGVPSLALAVDREAGSPGGKVVMTTGRNLAVLDAGSLTSGVRLRFVDDLTPGTTGFLSNSPAVMGTHAYVSRDDGGPLVVRIGDAQAVGPEQFTRADAHTGTSIGQPAIDGTLVVFTTQHGLFGYDATAPSAANSPVLTASAPVTSEGAGSMRFTVRLSRLADRTVRARYSTADGAAVAGADYQAVSGTVEIPSGSLTATVDVPLVADEIDEADEAVALALSEAEHAVIATGDAFAGLITDDDDPAASVLDATITERDGGTVPMSFTVRLGAVPTAAVTIGWATADDTARGGVDYDASIGELRFEPGEREKTITVGIRGDFDREDAERFHVDLFPVGGSAIARNRATGTIKDDDGPVRRKDRRARPMGLVTQLFPLRDTRAPYRFSVRGRLLKPRRISKRRACRGKVLLRIGTGDRVLVRRTVKLRRNCRFSGSLTVRRLPKAARKVAALRVRARFRGNARLQPLNAPSLLARLS